MTESIHKKMEKVRPPRVHIQYEVELEDAIVKKELPFVVGVMADLSGHPLDPPAKLKDESRAFDDINRDNFDQVLASMRPRLAIRVADKLSGEPDRELPVELQFKKLDDFSPENVVRQVEPLAKLLEQRNKLKDLQGRMEPTPILEEQLDEILKDAELRDKLRQRLQTDDPGGASPTGEEK